jgi:hypothetical protein
MWIWDRIRGVGGKRGDQAAEREEYGGDEAGEADEKYLAETGLGGAGGLAGRDAAEVAEADLDEFKAPRDAAP